MEAARRLLARLQTPYERTFTLTCAEPMTIAGVQMLQNLEVWKQWTEKHHQRGNNAQSLEDILDMCNVPVEPNLMRENRTLVFFFLVPFLSKRLFVC